MVAVLEYLDKNECTCNMMFPVQVIKDSAKKKSSINKRNFAEHYSSKFLSTKLCILFKT